MKNYRYIKPDGCHNCKFMVMFSGQSDHYCNVKDTIWIYMNNIWAIKHWVDEFGICDLWEKENA